MNTLPLAREANPSQKNSGEAYLRLQLDAQTQAVLPMQQIQEVLVVPAERLTPIPNMPEWVLGLLNQRSRVFWAIDLPCLLALSPPVQQAQEYNIAIARSGNTPLGLVVQKVQGAIRLSEAAIQSPVGNVAPGLVPYLRGCVLQQSEILLVLDAEAIVHSSFRN